MDDRHGPTDGDWPTLTTGGACSIIIIPSLNLLTGIIHTLNKKVYLNCPPWLEKIVLFFGFKLAKNTLKLSPMVGENFDIFWSQTGLKITEIVPHGWRNF